MLPAHHRVWATPSSSGKGCRDQEAAFAARPPSRDYLVRMSRGGGDPCSALYDLLLVQGQLCVQGPSPRALFRTLLPLLSLINCTASSGYTQFSSRPLTGSPTDCPPLFSLFSSPRQILALRFLFKFHEKLCFFHRDHVMLVTYQL